MYFISISEIKVIGMVRKYKRLTSRGSTYSRELENAVKAVREGMPYLTAEQSFGVPRNTIRRHYKGRVKAYGGETFFTADQEKALVDRTLYLSQRGFPISIDDFCRAAYAFAQKLRRRKEVGQISQTWLSNRKASYDWLEGFRKRNPSISLRVAENLSVTRAEAFNEARIRNFFNEVAEKSEMLDIFDDYPNLVYNCDETGLSTVPNSSNKVLAVRGARTVQKVSVGERGTLTTLIPCGNASGQLIPPFLIFNGHAPVDVSLYPQGTKIFYTHSGYVDQTIFLLFLKHFEEHKVHVPGKRCILFLDGHTSHITVESIQFANESGIELFCLPPHSSHRLQPLDTHFNKPLKAKWSEVLSKYLKQSDKVFLNKTVFVEVFSEVWNYMTSRPDLLINGFTHCGLFPLKNPTTSADFEKSKSFISSEASPREDTTPLDVPCSSGTATVSSDHNSSSSAIRSVLSSPRKHSNPNHRKEHVAYVSSPTVLGQKMILKRKKETVRPDTVRPKKSKSIHVCCVCREIWTKETIMDWFRCIECSLWACETCFASTKCATCESRNYDFLPSSYMIF